jgi:hypothetical protein
MNHQFFKFITLKDRFLPIVGLLIQGKRRPGRFSSKSVFVRNGFIEMVSLVVLWNFSWTTVLIHSLINCICKWKNFVHGMLISWLDASQQFLVPEIFRFIFEVLQTIFVLVWSLVISLRTRSLKLTLQR